MIWLWAIAFSAMVLFAPGLADPYMTPKMLAIAAFCLPLLLSRSDQWSSLELPAVGFMLAATLATVLAEDRGYSLIGPRMFPFDSLMATGCYCVVLVAAARSGATVMDAARIVTWMSIPVSSYAIAQRIVLNADPLLPSPLTGITRVIATQGGPVFLGAMLALAIVCACYMASMGYRVGWIALLLALPAIWFTQTRGAMVAAIVGCAMVVRSSNFSWPAVFAGCAVIIHRLATRGGVLSTQSDAGRLEVWRVAWGAFKEHPIFGWGPGNFFLAFRQHVGDGFVSAMGTSSAAQAHAHNDILHVMVTMGIVGVLAYSWLGLCVIRMARSRIRIDERGLLLGLIAVYVLVSKVNPVSHAIVGVLVAILGVASAERVVAGRRLVPALAGILVVGLSGRMCLADWHYAAAFRAQKAKQPFIMAAEFNRAAQINPIEIQLTGHQLDSLNLLLPTMDRQQAKVLSMAGAAIARQALARHPKDSFAHEIYGRQLLIAHVFGVAVDPRESLRQFNEAQRLAPTFEPVMIRRIGMAKGLRDRGELARAQSDLARVQGLVR